MVILIKFAVKFLIIFNPENKGIISTHNYQSKPLSTTTENTRVVAKRCHSSRATPLLPIDPRMTCAGHRVMFDAYLIQPKKKCCSHQAQSRDTDYTSFDNCLGPCQQSRERVLSVRVGWKILWKIFAPFGPKKFNLSVIFEKLLKS